MQSPTKSNHYGELKMYLDRNGVKDEPSYQQSGPSHLPKHKCIFTVKVENTDLHAEGEGKSKKEAQNSMSMKMLSQIKNLSSSGGISSSSRLLENENGTANFSYLRQTYGLGLTLPKLITTREGPDHNPTFHTKGTYQMEYKGKKQELSAAGTGKNKKDSCNKLYEKLNKIILNSIDLTDKDNEPGSDKDNEPLTSSSTAASKQSSHQYFILPGKEGRLGSGGFGSVYVCVKELDLNKILALKIPDNYELGDDDDEKQFQHEVEMHKRAQEGCEFIVKMFEVIKLHRKKGIVMEYYPRGSLCDVNKDVPLSPSLICRIHKEISEAIRHLHKGVTEENNKTYRVTHNDIKPQNVLISGDFHAYLSDFGGSTMATNTYCRSSDRKQQSDDVWAAETSYYKAPERQKNRELVPSTKSDVYSLGVCLHESLCRGNIIKNSSFFNQLKSNEYKTVAAVYKQLKELEEEKSRNPVEVEVLYYLLKVLLSCCTEDYDNRPGVTEIFNRFNDLYKKYELEKLCESKVKQLISSGKYETKPFKFDRKRWENASESKRL